MRNKKSDRDFKAKKTSHFIAINETSHISGNNKQAEQPSQVISQSNKKNSHLHRDGPKSQSNNTLVIEINIVTIIKNKEIN